jgi:hypothetical protein
MIHCPFHRDEIHIDWDEIIVEVLLYVVKQQYDNIVYLLCLARLHYAPPAPCHSRTVPSQEAEVRPLLSSYQTTFSTTTKP